MLIVKLRYLIMLFLNHMTLHLDIRALARARGGAPSYKPCQNIAPTIVKQP